MVIEPAFGTFGSVGRCQVLLENEISISIKLVSRRKHGSALKFPGRWLRWLWTSENTVDQHQQMTWQPKSSLTVETSHWTSSYMDSVAPHQSMWAERSGERSVRNIVGARSGFLFKGRSDGSVSLRFRSDTAHTTSLGLAQIHPQFTCAFNN